MSPDTPRIPADSTDAMEPEAYDPVPDWPRLPPGLVLGAVSDVALAPPDRVYVLQRGTPPVLVFDRDGCFLSSWGADQIEHPHYLTIDHRGRV